MATTTTTPSTPDRVAERDEAPVAQTLLDQAVASAKARPPAVHADPAAGAIATVHPPSAAGLGQGSIVVALDGSEFAHAALPPAIQMARCLGMPLTIVQAAGVAKGTHADGQLEAELAEAEALRSLRCAADEARAQGVPVAEVMVRGALAGSPARAILAAAEEFDAKTIVLATHGRTGLSRALHGSVASEVVQGTTTPVLLVRPQVAE